MVPVEAAGYDVAPLKQRVGSGGAVPISRRTRTPGPPTMKQRVGSGGAVPMDATGRPRRRPPPHGVRGVVEVPAASRLYSNVGFIARSRGENLGWHS